jgi:hypothetical protein
VHVETDNDRHKMLLTSREPSSRSIRRRPDDTLMPSFPDTARGAEAAQRLARALRRSPVPSKRSITLRAPAAELNAFTMAQHERNR